MRKVFRALGIVIGIVFCLARASAQVDPFYLKLLQEGKFFCQKARFAEAVKDLEIASFGFLDSPPQLLECYIYLIICHQATNNLDRARFCRDEIVRLNLGKNLDGLALPKDLKDKYLETDAAIARTGGRLLAAGAQRNPKDARRALERLLEPDPRNGGAYFEIVLTYLRENKPKKALEPMERAATLLPGDIEIRSVLAKLYYDLKMYGRAPQEFANVQTISAAYKDTVKYLAELETEGEEKIRRD